jgi:hypothetical protein
MSVGFLKPNSSRLSFISLAMLYCENLMLDL